MGAGIAVSAEAAGISSLLAAPPVAIEVQAESITAFDPHDPSRKRLDSWNFAVA